MVPDGANAVGALGVEGLPWIPVGAHALVVEESHAVGVGTHAALLLHRREGGKRGGQVGFNFQTPKRSHPLVKAKAVIF